MTKWFIDCHSIIHPVTGTDSDPEWFVVNYEEATVYTVNEDHSITGEYVLWNSLTELALAIEEGDQGVWVDTDLGRIYSAG